MALLNNAIVNGSCRILGKLYVNDMSVTGTTSFATVTATAVSTGTLSASGAATLSSTLTVSGQGIFSRTTSPALIVGGTSSQAHIEIGSSTIQGKTNASTNGDVSINSSGGAVNLSNGTSIQANNGTLTASKLIATNAVETAGDVYCETLRAKYYDLQTVFASSGGALIVAPTAIFPSATTSVTRQLIVTKNNNTLSLTIQDGSITTSTLNTAYWKSGAYVKVSGIINGVQTDTMDGTISSDITNNKLVLSVSGGNAANVVADTYTPPQYENLSVMVYKIGNNRVGIFLNAVSDNNSAVMDIYSGTDANVVVRSGNINGLTYTQSDGTSGTLALTNGWGFYAKGNAYIEGHIVASSGMIGGWSINATKIFNGALGVNNSAYLSVTDLANGAGVSIGGSTALTTWRIAAGSKFGVTKDGDVYASNITATGGKIGKFDITATYLASGSGSTMAGMGGNQAFWAGSESSNSAPFRVGYDGTFVATSATVTGSVTATSGTIGGITANSSYGLYTNSKNSATSANTGFYISKDGAIYLGAYDSSKTSCPFQVTSAGALTARSGTIGGFTIDANTLSNSTLGSNNSIYLSTADIASTATAKAIGGSSALRTWRIAAGSKFGVTKNGDVYASNINATGVINADTGSFGGSSGFTIASGAMYSNSKSSTTSTNDGVYIGTSGIYLGAYNSEAGSCPFQVTDAGALTATSATISGTLTAGNGSKIGDWDITSARIQKNAAGYITGMQAASADTSAAFFAGWNGGGNITQNSAFWVRQNGSFYAQSGKIGNWSFSDQMGLKLTENGYRYFYDSNGIHCSSGTDYVDQIFDLVIDSNKSASLELTDNATVMVQLNVGGGGNAVFGGTVTFGYNGKLISNSNGNTGFQKNDNWTIYEDSAGIVHIPHPLATENLDGTSRRPVGTANNNNNGISHVSSSTTGININAFWGAASRTSRSLTVPSSDIRLKENIKSTTLSGLDLINKIDMYEFDWKDDKRHQKLGFVADYLEKLDPNLSIGGGEDEEGKPDYKSVNTFYLQGYEVRAIQELSSENSALKKKITELEERISRLEKR